MKVVWSPSDVRGGRLVTKPDTREVWMIGYHGSLEETCLVSQSDGLVTEFKSQADLATSLTKDGLVPKELSDTVYFKST